jgi:hypothetical protein
VQAFTQGAFSQNLQVIVAFRNAVNRMTRILEANGFQVPHFSRVQAYSQIPQPVHLLGSTETNLLALGLANRVSLAIDGALSHLYFNILCY